MTEPSSKELRVDPCHSKVFSWLFWQEHAEAVLDERGRTIQPAGPAITARYRTTGMEMTAFPVTEEEARKIMWPDATYNFSSGRAWSQIVMPYLSKRIVKPGDRQETKRQREQAEQQAGRRWLA